MPRNTIIQKGEPISKEAIASSAITPGHLVEFGGANELQVHGTAAGRARKAFARENDLVGDGIDDAYDAGDTVLYNVYRSGDEVYALLADGENAAKGAALVSDGAGALAVIGSGETEVVGYAMEAVDNSAGGAEARIIVEVA